MRRLAPVLVVLLPTTLVPAVAAAPEPFEEVAPVGVWPLRPEPVVVHGFDPPATTWGAGHRGVDLLARPGQPVRAALPGTVTFAATLAGRGVVVVAHGTTRTTYEPVEAAVETGTVVGAGERLGNVQAAPSHCAPRTCLHWGWVEGESYLDPLRLVGLGPVRLLPYLSEGAGGGGSADRSGRSGSVGAGRATVVRPPVPVWW